jgi:hypothetical protein
MADINGKWHAGMLSQLFAVSQRPVALDPEVATSKAIVFVVRERILHKPQYLSG